MKKIRLVGAMVLLIALLAGMTAYAMNGSFSFAFFDVTTTTPNSAYGYRATAKGPGKDWTVSINSGTVTNSNILGMAPRSGPYGELLGAYSLYTYVGTYYRSYSKTIQCGASHPVYVRAKKDDSSVSTEPLTAVGSYTP